MMPRVRRISSRSVAQNEPLPGLSMTTSPGSGASSGMISQPGSPRTRMRPHGPASPMPGRLADPARAPALVGGQVGEVGAMAFARVDDVEAAARASRAISVLIGSIGARVSDRS